MELFLTFAKVGMFTFGGGYAMIAIIENACVEKKKWITHEDMMNLTIIAESTPGPIAINCATFVGYRKKGIWGAIFATIGMILPSFFIILLISKFLDGFLDIQWVANAFRGIKIAVGLLICDAAWKMIKKMPAKIFPRVVMIGSFLVILLINLLSVNFSSIVLMLVASGISILVFLSGKRGKKEALKN